MARRLGPGRVAVVGHVEWTTIVRVDRLPVAGEISRTAVVWEGPAGGGAVAAVRTAALTGGCTFYTALGNDREGARARRLLNQHGVRVHASRTDTATSRAVSLIDASGERTTLTIGERLQPQGTDALPWSKLDGCDGVYFTAGDPAALRQARRARLLAVTSRELATLRAAAVPADLLVGSAADPDERYDPGLLDRAPGLTVLTAGRDGGAFITAAGERGRYPATPPPGATRDTYGVGDNFAAALTVALARGESTMRALRFAAACGAECLTVCGAYRSPPPRVHVIDRQRGAGRWRQGVHSATPPG